MKECAAERLAQVETPWGHSKPKAALSAVNWRVCGLAEWIQRRGGEATYAFATCRLHNRKCGKARGWPMGSSLHKLLIFSLIVLLPISALPSLSAADAVSGCSRCWSIGAAVP